MYIYTYHLVSLHVIFPIIYTITNKQIKAVVYFKVTHCHTSRGFPKDLAEHFLSAINLFKPQEVVNDPIVSLVTKLIK